MPAAKDKPNGLIEVRIHKATLYLTREEFTAGLRRGKAIKRQQTQAKREQEKAANKLNNNQS